MESKKIKIGIIGMGRMGITHFSIINSHPDIKITAVADPSTLVTTLFKKYIKDVTLYKDYNEMIEKEVLDGILVCTPPNLHFDIIKKASDKNIHIFTEKPFTTSLNEATELASIYEEKQLVNYVGYVNRYNDCFVKAKTFIENNIIGEIVRFKSEMFSCTITKSDEGSGWRATRENGGGAVFEMASHAIDLVNYLIGTPDKIIGTSLNKIFSKHVEDAVSSTFLYKNGMSGTIFINWSDISYRKPTNKIEVFGKKGKILVDQHTIKVYLNEDNKEENLRKGWNTIYITDVFKNVDFYVRGNEFTRQLFDFADAISNNSNKSLCSFKDGVNTIEVIDSMFKDYETNGLV